jgi:hypothetical protein
VQTTPLEGGGDGGGHTADSISGDTRSASLAPVRGARVLVGQPLESIWIRVVCLYAGLVEDSGTSTTLTDSTSLSS